MKNDMVKPDVGNSLIFYPEIKKYFDVSYPGLIGKRSSITAGKHKLELILKYLSTKKDSICEDIAKNEYENNKSTSKLKTITDNVREFINNNLIPQKLIKETGKVKMNNHHITTYGLTLFGILYTIHLFSKKENPSEIICNLAQEYSFELPKIFGMFEEFKKIIGNGFEEFLGFDDIGKIIQVTKEHIPERILDEFIPQMYNYYEADIEENDLIADQISFFIYNNLKENLIKYHNKNGDNEYQIHCKKNKIPKIVKPKGWIRKIKKSVEMPDMFRSTWNIENAEKKWIELINSKQEIKNWYKDLVKKAAFLNLKKSEILIKVDAALN